MNATREEPELNRERISRVDVAEAGSGQPPLLLLHGIGGAAESFAPQLAGLSARRRVLAWDAPGYRNSPDVSDAATMDEYVTVLLDVVDALNCDEVHLLGVSWGGVIATRAALRAPGSVRSLILADSSRGSGRTATGVDAMRKRAAELADRGPAAFARSRGPRLVAGSAGPGVVNRVVDVMSQVRVRGYRNAARSMAGTDHSAVLRDIGVSTLVLVGAEDVITGVEESHRLAAGIPRARMSQIEGAGHAANQERPVAFNSAVDRFLTELDEADTATAQPGGMR